MTLSVCMMVFNEEKLIHKCLESVKWVDEIVVVDTGSTDGTIGICRQFTDRVYEKKFEGFATTRNFSIEQAAGDWIFIIDADETVTPGLAEEIKQVISKGDKDAYCVPRLNYFYGKWFRGAGRNRDFQMRLFRKDRCRYGRREVHEEPEGWKTKGYLKNPMKHANYKDISEYIRRIIFYSQLEAEHKFQQGFRISRTGLFVNIIVRPVFNFVREYFVRMYFSYGFHGFVHCVFGSYYIFIKYLKILEMQNFKLE